MAPTTQPAATPPTVELLAPPPPATMTVEAEAMKGEPTKLMLAGELVVKAEGAMLTAAATARVTDCVSACSCGEAAPAVMAACMVIVCCSVGVLPRYTLTVTLTPLEPGPPPRRRVTPFGVACTTAPVATSVTLRTETELSATLSSCA